MKGAGAGVGLIVFVSALWIKPAFLQPLVIHYVGAAASALFWPGVLTLFWRRSTSTGVVAGLAGGSGIYILCVLLQPLGDVFPMHPFVFGFAASGLLVWAFSRLTPPQSDRQTELYFGRVA